MFCQTDEKSKQGARALAHLGASTQIHFNLPVIAISQNYFIPCVFEHTRLFAPFPFLSALPHMRTRCHVSDGGASRELISQEHLAKLCVRSSINMAELLIGTIFQRHLIPRNSNRECYTTLLIRKFTTT
jgi:hypothetical protein